MSQVEILVYQHIVTVSKGCKIAEHSRRIHERVIPCTLDADYGPGISDESPAS